jgi:outer membrane receptor protein involved in Fe transport
LNRPGVVGNPNLLPEKVGTFDLGIGFQGNHMQASVDYFHSDQTDSIVTVAGRPIQYMNLGEVKFNGLEFETKYYLRKDFFFQGSMLYQTNMNDKGQNNVTPIPNLGFKAGASYEGKRGLTIGVFEVSDGSISGFTNSVNPSQGSHNMLNANVRYDVSKYFPMARSGVALVIHGTNLTNHQVWLPGWGFTSVDNIPVQQGRVIYAGLEFAIGSRR